MVPFSLHSVYSVDKVVYDIMQLYAKCNILNTKIERPYFLSSTKPQYTAPFHSSPNQTLFNRTKKLYDVNKLHQMVVINSTISYYFSFSFFFFFCSHQHNAFSSALSQPYFSFHHLCIYFDAFLSFSLSYQTFFLVLYYFFFILCFRTLSLPCGTKCIELFTFLFSDSISYYYEFSKEQDFICSKPEDSGMHQCSSLPPYRIGPMICNGMYIRWKLCAPTFRYRFHRFIRDTNPYDICVGYTQQWDGSVFVSFSEEKKRKYISAGNKWNFVRSHNQQE